MRRHADELGMRYRHLEPPLCRTVLSDVAFTGARAHEGSRALRGSLGLVFRKHRHVVAPQSRFDGIYAEDQQRNTLIAAHTCLVCE